MCMSLYTNMLHFLLCSFILYIIKNQCFIARYRSISIFLYDSSKNYIFELFLVNWYNYNIFQL